MADLLKQEIDLIDCYRLAVDFGRPAAERAIALINETLFETKTGTPAAGVNEFPDQAM